MRVVFKVLFLISSFQLALGVGHACSCGGPGPVCSIQLGTSSIFRGTVIERTLIENVQMMKQPDGTSRRVVGNGKFVVRFAVQETFSGEANSEAVVYTAQQSAACGFPFAVGREYVVFTYQHEGELWTSHCTRTTLLEPGVENAAVVWMRNWSKAPSGSEIFGSVLLPPDSGRTTVPATVRLDGPERRDVVTDEEGKYSVKHLRAGEYTVSAQLPDGFATQPPFKAIVADKGCAGVNWWVTYEGRVRGRVSDVDRRPVVDQRLELKRSESLAGTPRVSVSTTTLVDGSYEFEHVSPGEYVVAVRSAGALTEEGASTIYYPHSNTVEEAQIIKLGASATADQVNFVLARLRTTVPVVVRVVMPDGSAAPAGMELFAFPNNSKPGEPWRSAITDSTGVATLPLFAGKDYWISVTLDRNHPMCGNGLRMVVSEGMEAGVLSITNLEACRR
ncbi:carboxypeptidase family protein [Edaphobacter aggregans]|uniref:Carboxypeptidase family protein n=1 Tax=Edaphobacter aggregans TaxID=570835 RepID=A0A428MGX7_9BACT|nr:hypothetical protein [Edaphobacter aggregans]RSL16090.1 carboxypeptidase family protein [Edaphobacter aggregans]